MARTFKKLIKKHTTFSKPLLTWLAAMFAQVIHSLIQAICAQGPDSADFLINRPGIAAVKGSRPVSAGYPQASAYKN
jgi:hypothetical protein